MTRRSLATLVPLAAGVFYGACRRTAPPATAMEVAWSLAPSSAVVGPATLTLTLRNALGVPVTRAVVRLEAHMSHPGMAPVLANAVECGQGVYEIRFEFTMRGDWALLVSIVLPDGARVERRIDVAHVRPAA